MTPATATLAAGQTQTFTAAVTNDGTATPGVTWTASAGTITSAGVYTAPTPVGSTTSVTITATSKTDTTKTATATVTLTPISVTALPASVTLAAGQTQTFTATVTGDTVLNQGVTWSASVGTISSAGVYTAPTPIVTATATITATSKTDTSKTSTATVTLTPISVSVNPSSATLSANGTQTFTATVTGDSVLNQGVTWSASAGTISATGLYTAPASISTNTTATVTATSKTDTSKSNTATVNLQAPVALSITTASLPAATTGVAYSQTLVATGGTAPYTWTITSGGLPGSLTLSTAGVISGTPANPITTTASFAVKVTDSASATSTKALTLTSGPALTAGANNSELNGTYAFLVQGMYNGNGVSSSGKVYGETVIGSMTLNGSGSVNSGSIDNYDARNAASSTTLTGSYTLGSDNRGTLILNTGTRSFTFDIAAAGISGGIANRMKLVQFEDNNALAPGQAVATGFGKMQTSSAFQQLSGTYVFGMDGETSCTGCATVTVNPFGSVAMAGYFKASGGTILSGTADAHAFNANYNGLTLSGSTAAPVTGTGRGTITLAVTGTNFPTMPTHFVYYVLNANELLIASTDPHNATSGASGMLAGSMQLQTIGSYGASTLGGGNFLAYQDYENCGNGTTSYAQCSGAIVLEAQLTSNSSTFSVLFDENDGNNSTPKLNVAASGLTYNLGTDGRFTVNGATTPPILYFSAAGTGYGVDQSVGGDGGLYFVMPQSGGPFSNTTGAGTNAAVVTAPPSVVSQGTFTGVAAYAAGGGSVTLTQDYVVAGTLTPGNVITVSFALDPGTGATTGRGTTANSVIYVVNPNKSMAIDSVATGAPNITILENQTTALPF